MTKGTTTMRKLIACAGLVLALAPVAACTDPHTGRIDPVRTGAMGAILGGVGGLAAGGLAGGNQGSVYHRGGYHQPPPAPYGYGRGGYGYGW
jgi:hypothetical protein